MTYQISDKLVDFRNTHAPYHSRLTKSFFSRDQIEEIPVVGDAVDLWAPPVVEIDAHGGVDSCPITTNNQHPPTTTIYHQLPPVVEIDAHGLVEI